MGYTYLEMPSIPLIYHVIILILTLVGLVYLIFRQHTRLKKTLDERDRILQSFKRIYQLILEDLDYNTVVRSVADIISTELAFATGVLAIFDESKATIKRVAASYAKEEVIIEVPVSNPDNLMSKAVRERRVFSTNNVYDVLRPVISAEEAGKIQNLMSIKTTTVFPIFMQDKPLGVFITNTHKDKKGLSEYELEVIDSFVNLIGLALQDAKIYTFLKDTSQLLEQANLKLMQVDELKDDFVSVASHELRTPMTAIKSYAWMALNKSDITLSDKLKRYLAIILSSTDRLINLVNDMLNISRIESGRVEIVPEVFDIKKLVLEACTEVSAKALEKGIRLRVSPDVPPKVFADSAKVSQVLLNLLGNSLKFTGIDGLIEVSFFSDGRLVDVSIKDNGVGIAYEDISRLFQKFERLDHSYETAGTSSGTGLGLYISKSLVELMHGRIWAHSEGVGKGAVFTFSLPVATKEVLDHPDQFSIKSIGEVKNLEPAAI